MARPSITLVVALIVLFASLAAFLLANSLQAQLRETQDQLEEAQRQLEGAQSELQQMREANDRQQKTAKGGAGAAGRAPGAVNKSPSQDDIEDKTQNSKSSTPTGQDQEEAIVLGMQGDGGFSVPYLLLVFLGLVVLASIVLIVLSALSLLSGVSRSGRPGVESGGSAVSYTEASDLGGAGPLEDGRWMKLVEECVEVVDDLEGHMSGFDGPRREVARHVILRLEEILERSGVEVIANEATFDRTRHKPDSSHAATDNGAAIHQTLSLGFAVGPRVLRRARVRLE